MLASTATSCACCQAKSALLFLYKEVLDIDLPWLDNVERAKAPKRLPVVLTREEVSQGGAGMGLAICISFCDALD